MVRPSSWMAEAQAQEQKTQRLQEELNPEEAAVEEWLTAPKRSAMTHPRSSDGIDIQSDPGAADWSHLARRHDAYSYNIMALAKAQQQQQQQQTSRRASSTISLNTTVGNRLLRERWAQRRRQQQSLASSSSSSTKPQERRDASHSPRDGGGSLVGQPSSRLSSSSSPRAATKEEEEQPTTPSTVASSTTTTTTTTASPPTTTTPLASFLGRLSMEEPRMEESLSTPRSRPNEGYHGSLPTSLPTLSPPPPPPSSSPPPKRGRSQSRRRRTASRARLPLASPRHDDDDDDDHPHNDENTARSPTAAAATTTTTVKTTTTRPESSGRKKNNHHPSSYTNTIQLHVYDLIAEQVVMPVSLGVLGEFHFPIGKCLHHLNSTLHGLGTGAYHVGLDVNGIEYAYGANSTPNRTGVFTCPPKHSPGYQYRCTIDLGSVVGRHPGHVLLRDVLAVEYLGMEYDLLRQNCVTFALDAAERLGVDRQTIPEWVGNLCGAGAAAQDTLQPLTQLLCQDSSTTTTPSLLQDDDKVVVVVSSS